MKRSMFKSIGSLLLVTVLILFLLPAAWAAKDGSGVNRVTTDGNIIAKDNNEAYISGYITNTRAGSVEIAPDANRALLLSKNDANEADNKGYKHLLPISENADSITVDIADNSIYYAKLELYTQTGARIGATDEWIAPGRSFTADLTQSACSGAAYFTIVVKNGNTGATPIGTDPADAISVTLAEHDEHITYGTAVFDGNPYTYTEVSGLIPSVFVPTGADGNNTTNVLGMVEAYGKDNNIVLAANAGIFYNNDNNTYCYDFKEADGVVISNGTVLKSTESLDHTQCDILVIDSDGELGWAPYHANADRMVTGDFDAATYYTIGRTNERGKAKIVSAVTGFVPVLAGGEILSGYDNYVAHYSQDAVRQIIGVKEDGTFVLLSGTWTLADAAHAAKMQGCVFAYNLDGGGSAETILGQTKTAIGSLSDHETYAAKELVEQSRGARMLPTYLVFTATNVAPVSATADSISAVSNQITYSPGVTLASLAENLTVTQHFKNANAENSTRTLYSAQAVYSNETLTHVLLGGGTVEDAAVKGNYTAPNGTLFHTKSETEAATSLSNNGNTRQSGKYYDYSTGYTLTTADSLATPGSKTITVSYIPGDGQAALSTTFAVTILDSSSETRSYPSDTVTTEPN